MPPAPDSPFRKHLDCIKDPRSHHTRHLLHDTLLLALYALLSGADSWTRVADSSPAGCGSWPPLLKVKPSPLIV